MSTIPSIELIKETSFGVEIEMTGITREAAARVCASVMGEGSRVEYTGEGYSKWTCFAPDGRKWKFASDGSILYSDHDRNTSCELESPVLTYSRDIETLQELIRALRRAGAKTGVEYNAGIHVHVSGKGHTPQTIKNFANLFYSNDEMIRKAIGIREAGMVGRREMRWCQPLEAGLIEKINACKTFEKMADAWYGFYGYTAAYAMDDHYNMSRYHILNLHRFFSTLGTPQNTVEVRAFNSSLHAGVVRSYILLVLAMNASALTQRTIRAKKNFTMQIGNEKFAMATWMQRMGCRDEMWKTPRELFKKRLDGDAAWRFGKNFNKYLYFETKKDAEVMVERNKTKHPHLADMVAVERGNVWTLEDEYLPFC